MFRNSQHMMKFETQGPVANLQFPLPFLKGFATSHRSVSLGHDRFIRAISGRIISLP